MWIDTHCHLDAPEFSSSLDAVIQAAKEKNVKAILLPAVKAADCAHVKELAHQYSQEIPGLVYTLGIHPLYTNQAQEDDIATLEKHIVESLSDTRFVGVGEIGLDYFVEHLDPHKQEFFFNAQLDLAQRYQLPVVLHVRRSQDTILKALRRRNISSGIAHAFNGSFQQAEQFIELGFKLGFGGAATYERALQIRRLLKELPLGSIVTETDSPDIPPAWLRKEGIAFNEPAFVERVARKLAAIRGVDDSEFASVVWGNAMQALPRWSVLCTSIPNLHLAS
ncbi:TatD family hydrolase [Polynucleobacter sp. AP-Capit-er-40B-B4]|uniref:TatD family hydrolase n=1 Tax=Polynucleobacter sp. AP-Capit-er-40B-B4 TaxID=2576927 RepID=UPI001C0C2D58|nr:TatD family hydrolase [Polynucleobacter sp. AP-Capit-er-40B-B4]MBU3580794.1 TatD family hydrolase [Polynucleobacter sp. AP-Capit-er-40B-B4]